MNTLAVYHFNPRKRPRPADGVFHPRLHSPQRKRSVLLVPSCLLGLPPIPEEAGFAAFDMGNFFSCGSSGCMPRDGGLGLYRDLVYASQDAPDLTVATRDDVGLRHAVYRKIDSRKAALQATAPPPYYKDALRKAGLHDKRLGEIEAEVRLHYEKLDEQRKPKEVCFC